MDGRHLPAPGAGRPLSLVIPAYNEAAGIAQAVAEALAALARLTTNYEIIVVDDGSQDETAALVKQAAVNPRVRLVQHPVNQGYGAALRTGFEAAQHERVAFTDADCQFHLDDLRPLLELAETNDVAVGRRVDRQDPASRRFASWGYNLLARTLLDTGVRDCDCALKVFRREALGQLLPETSGFFVNTEMLTRARQQGLCVAEAPVRHRPRLRGVSKVRFGDIPRTLAALLPFWWSRVLFAGQPDLAGVRGSFRHGFSLLVLAAFILCFAGLGSPLQEPQEARYAEIPRQMLAEGQWVVPVLHGQPYLDKPPLLYWCIMGCYQVCGVHDWAARLVPSAAAFLTILVVYGWGRFTAGPRVALAGAFILCLSGRFLYLDKLLTTDALLGLWVTSALAAAHMAVAAGRLRWRWWLTSALALGLGLLTKGPVTLVLVVPPLLLVQGLDRRVVRVGVRPWLAYLILAVGVAGPWFAAVAERQPDFLATFLWRHHVTRFVAPFDHREPLWFYLPGLVLGMLPWTLLLPGLGVFLARRSSRAGLCRPAALGTYLAVGLWGLAFFSMAGCKRATYVVPVMPPLALALGTYLANGRPGARLAGFAHVLVPRAATLARFATLVVLVGGLVVAVLAVHEGLLRRSAGYGAVAALAAFGTLISWLGVGRRPETAWLRCGGVTFSVLLAMLLLLQPAYARRFALKNQVRPFRAAYWTGEVAVACYPRAWESVTFYLQGPAPRIYGSEDKSRLIADLRAAPETLLYVKTGPALDGLIASLPADLEYRAEGHQAGVSIGRVRHRRVWPDTFFARR
jgi:4-amino-4-deoxy-L-arabinose transferase-like glycosyltransferase